MKLARAERFLIAYQALGERDRKRVEKAIGLMAANLGHPSLRVKKMQGTDYIWEASASLSIRITFQIEGETILLRNVGAHDKTLKRP